jgi:hypothetical protein
VGEAELECLACRQFARRDGDVGPGTDGEARVAPTFLEHLVVAELAGQEDVEPSADEERGYGAERTDDGTTYITSMRVTLVKVG